MSLLTEPVAIDRAVSMRSLTHAQREVITDYLDAL